MQYDLIDLNFYWLLTQLVIINFDLQKPNLSSNKFN